MTVRIPCVCHLSVYLMSVCLPGVCRLPGVCLYISDICRYTWCWVRIYLVIVSVCITGICQYFWHLCAQVSVGLYTALVYLYTSCLSVYLLSVCTPVVCLCTCCLSVHLLSVCIPDGCLCTCCVSVPLCSVCVPVFCLYTCCLSVHLMAVCIPGEWWVEARRGGLTGVSGSDRA